MSVESLTTRLMPFLSRTRRIPDLKAEKHKDGTEVIVWSNHEHERWRGKLVLRCARTRWALHEATGIFSECATNIQEIVRIVNSPKRTQEGETE